MILGVHHIHYTFIIMITVKYVSVLMWERYWMWCKANLILLIEICGVEWESLIAFLWFLCLNILGVDWCLIYFVLGVLVNDVIIFKNLFFNPLPPFWELLWKFVYLSITQMSFYVIARWPIIRKLKLAKFHNSLTNE